MQTGRLIRRRATVRPSHAAADCGEGELRARRKQPVAAAATGWLLFGVVVFVALALATSRLTPLGEAPDEPAHLEYVRLLIETGRIPAVPEGPGEVAYELHQPPMAYAVTATAVRGWWQREAWPELRRAAEFDFSRPPKRYVAAAAGLHGWWPPRLVSCFWAILFLPALWSCAGAMVREAGAGAAAFFLIALTPQMVFSFATFSNDAAAISLSTLAFALLLAAGRRRSDAWLLSAAGLCGLALWAKLTAAFLFFPLLVVVARWPRRRVAAAAGAVWLPMLSALLAFQATRGIPFGHAVPSSWGMGGGSPAALVTEPGWLVTLWLGTWAKLGWFNVSLPAPAYAWFLLPTAALGAGVWAAARARTLTGIACLAAVGGAFASLLLYMTTTDWQPQGRLLFPAIGPACALVGLGIERLGRRLAGSRSRIVILAAGGAIAVCLVGLRALHLAYAGT
ncbi:MAG: DUF2142 domain-containing protein [Thermoanaerobaculia bacterium]|nr:DUF2142 domain-containing protein [Thermoanaerobaculia bacterium]